MGNGAFGIGTDIEDVARFENRPTHFYERIFTTEEITYCQSKANPAQHFAARFCAKEALVKACGSLGIHNITITDFEITTDEHGVPHATMLSESLKNTPLTAKISLSHTKTMATATALIQKI